MTSLRTLWQRITTSRYTRALEAFARLECALREELARERAENHRLRAENRALLNSILGIAGVPPLPVVVAPLPPDLGSQPALVCVGAQPTSAGRRAAPGLPAVAGAASSEPSHDLPVGATPSSPKQNAIAAIPMRRRSWQQINRMLEFESTKKRESTVTS
jgi:hypothetical protein